jgi:hypothetical protein
MSMIPLTQETFHSAKEDSAPRETWEAEYPASRFAPLLIIFTCFAFWGCLYWLAAAMGWL